MDNKEKLMSISEWVNTNFNSKPAYIDQILPAESGEYLLISGKTGMGKSILAMNLAFCLATGTSFFGFNCKQVTVGMLSLEGGIDNIKDRIHKMLSQYPITNNLLFELREPFVLMKNRDYFINTFQGCQVVILDNLRNVTTGKYLEPDYASTFIKFYQEALREIGAVGILTHHIKKPGNTGFIEPGDVYSLKGATEYVDASTTVLLLERAKQGRSSDGRGFGKVDLNKLHLYFAKHRIETKELPEYINLYRDYNAANFKLIINGEE